MTNSSVPVWEVAESDLKPFSNGDAAIKTTLKLLEVKDDEWLVCFLIKATSFSSIGYEKKPHKLQ